MQSLAPNRVALPAIICSISGYFLGVFVGSAQAQIVPDGTLGAESSVVTPDVVTDRGLTDMVEGGAIRQDSLFHSFTEFTVLEGRQAHFANPDGITNIFSRVTGSNISEIYGTLGVLGDANLVLLNPNGVFFGPEAQLDIRGSFVASTASDVGFESGYAFGLSNLEAPPLLTVGSPLGLASWLPQSGTVTSQANLSVGDNLGITAGSINLTGQLQAGNQLEVLASDSLTIRDSSLNPTTLAAGGALTLQGNQQLDINVLSHPDSFIASGGDLTLRSDAAVIGDAHFSVGGDFNVVDTTGTVGSLISNDDPIVLSLGDVTIGDYVGASLHIIAGGFVELGNVAILQPGPADSTINSSNATVIGGTQTPISSLSSVSLTDGTAVAIEGNLQPTLDVRAGVDWSQSPLTGLPGVDSIVPPGSVPATSTASPSRSGIAVGEVAMAAPDGQVLLTNQYLPNTSLAADGIQVSAIQDQFFPGGGSGSTISIDARGVLQLPFPSFISSVGAPGGRIILLSDTAINQESGPGGISTIESVALAGPGNSVTLTAPSIFLGGDVVNLFVGAFGPGIGGDIFITTDSLETDLSSIAAANFGFGDSGNIVINSPTITLDKSAIVTSVLFDPTAPPAFGANGGDVIIDTGTLRLVNGSQVGAFTENVGNAGDVNIVADVIELEGFIRPSATNPLSFSSILSSVGPTAQGNGGVISIETGTLSLLNGAQIRASSQGLGDAGDTVITADSIVLDGAVFLEELQGGPPGFKPTFPSGIGSEMISGSTGDGGDISIQTRTLSVTNGGTISASSQSGNAGNVSIEATESVNFDGLVSFAALGEDDRISSASVETLEQATGTGGTLTITTPTLTVTNGARLEGTTAGAGDAGDVVLNIAETLSIDGENSGVFANTTPDSTGNGGDIVIDPPLVSVTNGGQISVSSDGSGVAGNIFINGGTLSMDQGLISAETVSSDGGNISLAFADAILLLNNSRISSTAGTALAGGNGGNIDIGTTYLVAAPTGGNSDITANAFSGAGGNVFITAEGILGIAALSRAELEAALGTTDPLQLDPANLSTNDITAISRENPELEGQVEIITPDTDPSAGLDALPDNVIDASRLIAQGCASDGALAQEIGSLVVTGRGGLPANPGENLTGNQLLLDWATVEADNAPVEEAEPTASVPTSPHQLQEVQSLALNADGQVVLVAQATGNSPELPALTCAGEVLEE
jgi:filamentous hemagglutinin family protein